MSDETERLFGTEEMRLSDAERAALKQLEDRWPGAWASARSILYTTKKLDVALQRHAVALAQAADASARYAEASARHTKSLTWATWVLAVATIVLAGATVVLVCVSCAR